MLYLDTELGIINMSVSGLQLAVLVAFGSIDEPLASCRMVHFYVYVF